MYHSKEDNPCWQCMDRTVGCHSGCEKYHGYVNMIRAEREAEVHGRKRDYPGFNRNKKRRTTV